jgi:hypothetical protein
VCRLLIATRGRIALTSLPGAGGGTQRRVQRLALRRASRREQDQTILSQDHADEGRGTSTGDSTNRKSCTCRRCECIARTRHPVSRPCSAPRRRHHSDSGLRVGQRTHGTSVLSGGCGRMQCGVGEACGELNAVAGLRREGAPTAARKARHPGW